MQTPAPARTMRYTVRIGVLISQKAQAHRSPMFHVKHCASLTVFGSRGLNCHCTRVGTSRCIKWRSRIRRISGHGEEAAMKKYSAVNSGKTDSVLSQIGRQRFRIGNRMQCRLTDSKQDESQGAHGQRHSKVTRHGRKNTRAGENRLGDSKLQHRAASSQVSVNPAIQISLSFKSAP